MNPIYQAMTQNISGNPMSNLMQRFQQFRNTFRGNPQQQIQQMLQSGQISQAQYDNAVRMAQQFQQFLK